MMARLAATTAGIVALAVAVGASPAGAAGSSPDPTVAPCPSGRPVGPHTVCRGPIVHHSGGGGGAVTIALSVLVGFGVAAGALLLVRRRITLDAAGPPPSRPSPGPR